MSDLRRRWDGLFDEVGSLRAVALVRLLFGPIVVFHLWGFMRPALEGRTYQDRFHEPFWSWLPHPPETVYAAAMVVGVVAGVMMTIGPASRAATAVATAVDTGVRPMTRGCCGRSTSTASSSRRSISRPASARSSIPTGRADWCCGTGWCATNTSWPGCPSAMCSSTRSPPAAFIGCPLPSCWRPSSSSVWGSGIAASGSRLCGSLSCSTCRSSSAPVFTRSATRHSPHWPSGRFRSLVTGSVLVPERASTGWIRHLDWLGRFRVQRDPTVSGLVLIDRDASRHDGKEARRRVLLRLPLTFFFVAPFVALGGSRRARRRHAGAVDRLVRDSGCGEDAPRGIHGARADDGSRD